MSMSMKITCPYCLTVLDSADYDNLFVYHDAFFAHCKHCRAHSSSEAVQRAMKFMTDRKDNRGVPVYAVPQEATHGTP